MGKRTGLNLVLLLVVVVLALLAYFESGRDESSARVQLSSLAVAEVERIQLQRPGAETISIERQGSRWMIVAPLRIAASDYRLDKLLKLLSARSHARFPATARPLADFGLESPRATLRFNEQTILFGDTESLGWRRYVLLGDQVHLIDDRYFYQSQLLLTALVDLSLIPAGRDLVRLRLPGMLLQQRSADWQWQQQGKAAAVAAPSMDAINGLLQAWRLARAQRVSHYQTDVVDGNVELEFSNGDNMAFEVLAREPELILGRKDLGLRFHFTAEQGRDLLILLPPVADISPDPDDSAPALPNDGP